MPVQIKSIYTENGHLIVGLNGAEQDTTHVLNGSLWISSDEGNSWTEITGNMHATNVYGNNVVAGINGELLVGTYGGGIFRSNDLTLGTASLTKDEFQIALFPNPTSEYVVVTADLSSSFNVDIIDNSGRFVLTKKATDGQKIDVQQLPSGSYELVISTETTKVSKSLVIQ